MVLFCKNIVKITSKLLVYFFVSLDGYGTLGIFLLI